MSSFSNIQEVSGGGAAPTLVSLWKQGANVASTADLALGNDGNLFLITGSNSLESMSASGWSAGSLVTLAFNDTATVENAFGTTPDFLLAGGASFNAQDKATLTLVYDGTAWLEVARSLNVTP